jgi:6-phospho-beta-glucosidase
LIVQAITLRQEKIGITELALMDIDSRRLDLIAGLTSPLEESGAVKFKLTRTTDVRQALNGADFVITTFRVGGMASRIIDERVPIDLGVLGQETTGPGGFSMGLRTIPVLIGYIKVMEEVCPNAWLINFANPAGMLAEAVVQTTGWSRVVGICDAPSTILRVAAAVLHAHPDEVLLDYFGLNHLGWVRGVRWNGHDYLPQFISMLHHAGSLPYLPFDPQFIASLGMIPNEYLFYYYHTRQAIENIKKSGLTRGEQLSALNQRLFDNLERLDISGDTPGMIAAYRAYLTERDGTYMASETGHDPGLENLDPAITDAISGEGYAGVALDLIEGLLGCKPRHLVVNVPNRGAVAGLSEDEVVEVPAYVNKDIVRPLAVGTIPEHCLGLIKLVKTFEKLTIQAAVEQSYNKALLALSLHPLVPDQTLARQILDGYLQKHGDYFPPLR